jgi:protein-disulfide isomerase
VMLSARHDRWRRTARPGRSRPLSTKTAAPPPPSRRARRIAARSGVARTPDLRAAGTRRGTSPIVWITVAAGVFGLVLVAALLVFQGGPRTVDVASLKSPISAVPAELVDGRSLGDPAAPVTLEVWSDFQCPACRQFAELIEPTIIRNYVIGGTLRIIDHDAAFQGKRVGASYDESVEAGAGARCAADQDAYWPFHDWLFANQVGENEGAFRDERLRAIATAAGLDVAAWDACRATGEQQAAVRAETQEGVDLGVSATPTMFLNGQAIVGVKSAAELGQLIEAAAGGVPAQ